MERDVLLALLMMPSGYSVDLFAILGIRGLENGTFEVWYDNPVLMGAPIVFTEHRTAEAAVDDFLRQKAEYEIGLEFEV